MYAVVFDMDGTLLDLPLDMASVRAEVTKMFTDLGYTEPMRRIFESINQAAASIASSDQEMIRLIDKARGLVDVAELQASKNAKAREGAVDCIRRLKRLGIPMGIVSNNSRECIAPALRTIGCRIEDFVVSAREDVPRLKPAPDGLIRVVSLLAMTAGRLWYVGDSPVDISAAVAANSRVTPQLNAIAVQGPRSSRQQLQAAGPCQIFESLSAAVDGIVDGFG